MSMSTLEPTRHAMTRLAQRAIAGEDLDLIMLIATEVEDGYIVRAKDARAFGPRRAPPARFLTIGSHPEPGRRRTRCPLLSDNQAIWINGAGSQLTI
jgi:hypothetical protein